MSTDTNAAAATPQLSIGKGIGVTLGLVVVIAGFVALGTAVGIVPLFAGFLLLWFFATVDNLDFKAAPATIVGALGGLATAWAMQVAMASGDPMMIAGILLLIVVALFCSVMNYLQLVVNPAYMLYLTVATAPLLQAGADFSKMAIAMMMAVAYFGIIIFVIMRVIAGKTAKVVEVADASIAT